MTTEIKQSILTTLPDTKDPKSHWETTYLDNQGKPPWGRGCVENDGDVSRTSEAPRKPFGALRTSDSDKIHAKKNNELRSKKTWLMLF